MRRLSLLLLCFAGCQCQPLQMPADAGLDAGGVRVLEFVIPPFTPVLRGQALERTGTFTTTGDTDVELTGLALSGEGFELLAPVPVNVPAGGQTTITVRFQPTTLGAQTGTLTFNQQTFTLQGLAIGPALGLEPAQIDLGMVPLYDGAPARASTTLTLRNGGLDTTPSTAATALQVFFDVQSTSAAASGELCAGDCTAAPSNVLAGESTVVPLELTSTSVGLKTFDVRVFSNDPTAPLRTIPVTAEVVARPTCQFALPPRLDFGVVTQPERRDLEVLFENVGTEPCEVSGVELGPQSTPLFSVLNPEARTVAPGEVLHVLVRAWPQDPAPSTPSIQSAELRLAINHPDGFARVSLAATLENACLWISPSPIDFATVQTGCRSVERTVTMQNVCNHPVVVTSALLPGFSSFSASGAFPRTLAFGESVTLTARYSPFVSGPERNRLEVSWLDGAAAKKTLLPLLGEANTTGITVDRFAPLPQTLDVLLVLDDSALMADQAPLVATQLPRLLTQLQGVDFHLGVVTGQAASAPGVLRRRASGVRWLSPATTDLTAGLAELTTFTGLSSNPSCEVPALAALTPPLITDSASNGGFRRAEALLSVLCITTKSELADLLPRVLELSRRPRWDVIGPVRASTASCTVDYLAAQDGLAEFAQATGGQVHDLCDPSWSGLLEELAGQTTVGPRRVFPLRLTPEPAAGITVSAAGQPVPSANGAWAWEPNLVRFGAGFGPAPNTPVEISYPTLCTP